MASFPTNSSATVDHGGFGATIATVHPDIIQTHILNRLDGPSLATAACTSSHLHELCTGETLWRDICTATWPSVNDPRVDQLISAFPAGHRSFFSDSFPLLDHQPSYQKPDPRVFMPELISAVDIYYQNKAVFSKIQQTETASGWFLCSPFRVDLLDPKEWVPTPIQHGARGNAWLEHLEENLTLSWILIDPTRKRAVNLSSRRPISVQRHWLTGDVQLRFATIMAGDRRRGSSSEFVQCCVEVTCGGKEGGEMHVSEVSMVVEDMEGKNINGRDSMVILHGAIENGKRKRGKREEAREKFEEFMERTRERAERRQRRERVLDMVCIVFGIALFLSFWIFVLFR